MKSLVASSVTLKTARAGMSIQLAYCINTTGNLRRRGGTCSQRGLIYSLRVHHKPYYSRSRYRIIWVFTYQRIPREMMGSRFKCLNARLLPSAHIALLRVLPQGTQFVPVQFQKTLLRTSRLQLLRSHVQKSPLIAYPTQIRANGYKHAEGLNPAQGYVLFGCKAIMYLTRPQRVKTLLCPTHRTQGLGRDNSPAFEAFARITVPYGVKQLQIDASLGESIDGICVSLKAPHSKASSPFDFIRLPIGQRP